MRCYRVWVGRTSMLSKSWIYCSRRISVYNRILKSIRGRWVVCRGICSGWNKSIVLLKVRLRALWKRIRGLLKIILCWKSRLVGYRGSWGLDSRRNKYWDKRRNMLWILNTSWYKINRGCKNYLQISPNNLIYNNNKGKL